MTWDSICSPRTVDVRRKEGTDGLTQEVGRKLEFPTSEDPADTRENIIKENLVFITIKMVKISHGVNCTPSWIMRQARAFTRTKRIRKKN